MENLIQLAFASGFDHAGPLDPGTLDARTDIREMCRADKCHVFGKNWTCPPNCGTLEECEKRMHSYTQGLLVQTTGKLKRSVDWKGTVATEKRHCENFLKLAEEIRKLYPDVLCLSAGGCRVCENCAYPDPCRFPEKAFSSMEAYGLFVTEICRRNDMNYYYGECTITYTSCFLFNS